MAPASAAGARTGTSRPVRPWSTTWRQPRMSVATTGSPMAAASMAERGSPRGATPARRGPWRSTGGRRRRACRGTDAVGSTRRRGRPAPSASSLSGRSGPTTTNRTSGCPAGRSPARREHLGVALLPHQPADGADDDVVGSPSPSSARTAARSVGVAGGSKRSRSTPLPSRWSRSPGTRRRRSVVDVLGVLDQLGVASTAAANRSRA